MALQVWLPLNGNFNNQGLNNIQFTNNGATVNSSGKIGSCYSFNGSSNYLQATYNCYSAKYSICAWVYTTSNTATQTICCDRTTVGSGLSIFLMNSGKLRIDTGGNNLQWTTNYSYPTNIWFHLAIIYDGANVSYYINGVYQEKKAQSVVSSYWGTITSIGASQANGNSLGNYLNGKLNDFRIYNHNLSTKEIEEIARGLILHYKLDNNGLGGNNLATNTTFPTSTIQGYNGYGAVEYNHSDWTSGGRFFASYSNSGLSFTEIVANQPYTISAWVYIYDDVTLSNPGGTSIFYRIYKTGDSPTYSYDIAVTLSGVTERNKWVRVSSTFTSPATYTYNQGGTFSIGGYNGHFLVSMPKVELGTIATPWSPAPSELNFNNNIIYDCSGYNHNGIPNNTSISTSNSIRYLECCSFNGTDSYINAGRGAMVKDTISVCCWGYMTNWSNYTRLLSCTEGGGWNFEPSSGKMQFAISTGASSSTYKNAASTTTLANLGAGWHFFVGTYDGFSTKIYIDGVLEGTNNAYTTKTPIYYHTSNSVFIGAEAGASGTTPAATANTRFNGNISDVRVYATALSIDQIKELYNTSLSIDNSQKMHTFEVKEENENILAGIPYTNYYQTRSKTDGLLHNYNENGEYIFTANNTSAGTAYIEIDPGIYIYDMTLSINTGNMFYVGFERYDKDKTSRSNNATVYVYNTKPSSDIVKQRYTGTVDLSTDGTNPCKYIALRILNGWTNTTSGVTGIATIHNLSLRKQSTTISPQITKNGELICDEYKEDAIASLYKNGIVESLNILEY